MKFNFQLVLLSQIAIFGASQQRDSIDVCVSSADTVGVFTPDPNKYYTIRGSVTNQPWFMDERNNYNIVTRAGSEADERAHWRFVQQPFDGWLIRNRFNGMHLSLNPDLTRIGTQESKLARGNMSRPDSGLPYYFQCNDELSRVSIRMDTFSFCSDELATTRTNSCDLFPRDGTNISMGPRSTVDTQSTGCLKSSRTCQSLFGSQYSQISRGGCGPLTDRLTCKRVIPPSETERSSAQEWLIEEVEVFTKRGPNPLDVPPVEVANLKQPSTMSNVMALWQGLVIAGIQQGAQSKGILGALGGQLAAWMINESLAPITDDAAQQRNQLNDNIKRLAVDLTEQTEK